MVVEGEASCSICFTENQYSIFMKKDANGIYACRYGHKFREDANGHLKAIA